MTHNMYIYILITGVVSYIIRVLPLTLIRKPIENKYSTIISCIMYLM